LEAGARLPGCRPSRTQWQTIWPHILPCALPGILTGTSLGLSRAVGETAPLIVIGASTFITVDPAGPFSEFTVLPIQIYTWTTRAQGEFHPLAAAASVVLLVLRVSLNAAAVVLRYRFSRRLACACLAQTTRTPRRAPLKRKT
jgi:phosphate transport system permease protein